MRAFCVAGMAFGDEGKGAVTDYLVRRHGARLVVRYNGGPQAAHNVVTKEGLHHTFAQFGSGTLAGARTHLSRFMLIDPLGLAKEAEVLALKVGRDPAGGLTIDPECVFITPYHRIANRLREIRRGEGRYGSVGLGVGEAREDSLNDVALRAKDLTHYGRTLSRLRSIQARKLAEFPGAPELHENPAELAARLIDAARSFKLANLEEAAAGCECVVFEGAQGVLLDETYGFAPYNSWTDCTFANADRLLDEVGQPNGGRRRIGVFRSYFTRHGPGPFPTEDAAVRNPELHNGVHPWMGPFRQGWFDLEMARYACRVARPDELAVTHMDRIGEEHWAAWEYQEKPRTWAAEELFNAAPEYAPTFGLCGNLAAETGIPVTLESAGLTAESFSEKPESERSWPRVARSSISESFA